MRFSNFALTCFLLTVCLMTPSHTGANGLIFDNVVIPHEESGNYVRAINQLPDGRMVFVSVTGVDIYDGTHSKSLPAFPAEYTAPLKSYNGFHHMYLDNDSLLWIKDWGKVSCIDLRYENYRPVTDTNMTDIYIDETGRRIIQSTDSLIFNGNSLPRSVLNGTLQDVAGDSSTLYMFDDSGRITAFSVADGAILYHADAYPPEQKKDYSSTSLICSGKDGFYQIRNGKKGGFFHFSKKERSWTKILETPYTLNTLAIGDDNKAYISCQRGMWIIDLDSGEKKYDEILRTSHGDLIATEISTVYEDMDGGIWLGTFNRGILYYHPSKYDSGKIYLNPLNLNDTSGYFAENRDGSVYYCCGNDAYALNDKSSDGKPIKLSEINIGHTVSGSANTFVSHNGNVYFKTDYGIDIFSPRKSYQDESLAHKPLLTALYIHGERIEQGKDYNGHVILPFSESKTERIELTHNQNFIGLEYSTLDYMSRDSLSLSYRLSGLDPYTVKLNLPPGENRSFKIPYTNIPPGEYLLTVESGTNIAKLEIVIRPPWWRTVWAYALYTVFSIVLLLVAAYIYNNVSRKKMLRKHREDMLLARIRSLIDQCNAYENERVISECNATKPTQTPKAMDDSDSQFISKAMELVENNINTAGYSVEQLSRDLCMDRTGLYRKLMLLLDQSPSLFIRNIRLRHAAKLLLENRGLSIAEVAELTGFSSGSYLSKCFQEIYGCKPSEYAAKSQEST